MADDLHANTGFQPSTMKIPSTSKNTLLALTAAAAGGLLWAYGAEQNDSAAGTATAEIQEISRNADVIEDALTKEAAQASSLESTFIDDSEIRRTLQAQLLAGSGPEANTALAEFIAVKEASAKKERANRTAIRAQNQTEKSK